MKKNVLNVFVPVLLVAVFITACNNNDYSDKNTGDTDSAGTLSADSTMTMHTDTMMIDKTLVAPMDSAANTHPGMMHTDSLAKTNPALKKATTPGGKKGKVTILPVPRPSNTTAMEMDKEGFYKNAEILPAYPGGDKALERFFEDNIVYPEAATENDAEGTINLTFAVDENGKVYNPMVTGNKIGYGLEEEAIRVFKKMPTWTPGRIKGKNVKTRYNLPVKFQLY